jgi:hypothetical protein
LTVKEKEMVREVCHDLYQLFKEVESKGLTVAADFGGEATSVLFTAGGEKWKCVRLAATRLGGS